MISQCIFVLLLLIWCGHTCDNNVLIANVAVVGVTSGADHADSDTGHNACINHQCHKLPDLPGDDKLKNKGDWYNMANWNGMKICDVNDFRFKQGGNDGWQIAKVTVLIRGNNGRVYVPVFRDSFNRWIDGDSNSDQVQTDNLIQSGWRNDLPSIGALVGIQKVHLIAETGHVDNAESDTGHKLRIEFAGVSREAHMPDLAGDDYQKHKTDWWTFNHDFDIINVNDIHAISLKAGGHDGWVPHDVAVLIETNDGWFVPVMMTDMPTNWLQTDGGSNDMQIHLDMLSNWRGQPFIGFEETIGYWTKAQTGNGNEDGISFGSWEGFSETIAQESEQVQSFSQEVSAEVGVSVTYGSDFKVLTAEAQYSYTLGVSVGSEQAFAISDSIEQAIDGGTSKDCSFQNPSPGELFVFWVWTTYRKSNVENVGATLQTCNGHYKTGPNRNIPPNCIPGGCLDNECQDCLSSDWVIDPSATSASGCHDSCGGKSKHENCWCDSQCTSFNDCCSNYQSQCTRRELAEEENTEINGRRNLAETNKRGSAQRLLKML